MKILVTGGAGFIGSHIVDALVKLGHDVVVVDNLSTGSKENLNPKAKFYEVDITDLEKLKEVFEKERPELVNHHAAQSFVSVSVKKPFFDAQVNIVGSLNLLECCIKNNIKKIIYSNSGGASYGNPEYLPIDEKHKINPVCHYGISKHTVEHYLFLYNHLYGLKYTSLRYANIYGPRQDPYGEGGVVAIFTNKFLRGERPIIFGDGTHLRDYCYIKDVVEANILAMNKGDNQGYNVGTGEQVSTQEIFDRLKKLTKSDLEPIYEKERLGDAKAGSLNPLKIKQELGWQAKYDLDSGLKETVEYFKKKGKGNEESQKSNKTKGLDKLELGSGEKPTPGYLHQDITKSHAIDLDFVCNPWEIDLPENYLTEVLALGVMEHLRFEDFKKTIVYMKKLLKPRGAFLFDVPDMKIWSKYLYNITHGKEAPFPPKHVWSTIYGWQRWPGDEHKSGWTKDSLFNLLREIGFSKIEEGVHIYTSKGIQRGRFTRPGDAHIYIKAIK